MTLLGADRTSFRHANIIKFALTTCSANKIIDFIMFGSCSPLYAEFDNSH